MYRLAQRGDRGIELLTRDDTYAQLNETPPEGSSADDPARMVGNGAMSGANVALHELARGELLALCSDGVHKHLDDLDWERVLRQPLPLARRCERLITLARRHGSADDATVLLRASRQTGHGRGYADMKPWRTSSACSAAAACAW